MRALGLESHFLGQRYFTHADASAMARAIWGRSPTSFPTPTSRGSTIVDGYASEFDEAGGATGTSWAYDFWDAETETWGDTPSTCGLETFHLSFWEEPVIGRDGWGSGSRAVRLYDHDADFVVVFSVETHQRRVFTAGSGVGRIFAKVEAILGA
jgi:hypothetical protein